MNEFLLVLIKNNGNIIYNIFATSHKDLIGKHITPEDDKNQTYFRATFSPIPESRLDEVDNYRLDVKENHIPTWFTDAFAMDVKTKLKAIVNSMIITGRKTLLLHDGAILSGNAVVDEVKHSVIFAMYDNAHIKVVDNGSEIHKMTDDAIIDDMCSSTKVEEMWGFAKIKEMHDYSKVLKMWGQAKVGMMFDNSRIAVLKGDANILEMHGESQADRLKHMSKVDEMHGHSVIEEMWDWTVVEKMFDNARINYMDEDAKVCEMYGESMVDQMYGNSVVEKLYEDSLVRKLNDLAKILEKDLDKS